VSALRKSGPRLWKRGKENGVLVEDRGQNFPGVGESPKGQKAEEGGVRRPELKKTAQAVVKGKGRTVDPEIRSGLKTGRWEKMTSEIRKKKGRKKKTPKKKTSNPVEEARPILKNADNERMRPCSGGKGHSWKKGAARRWLVKGQT